MSSADLAREMTGSYTPKLQAMTVVILITQLLWKLLDAEVRRKSADSVPSHYINEEKEDSQDKVNKRPINVLWTTDIT